MKYISAKEARVKTLKVNNEKIKSDMNLVFSKIELAIEDGLNNTSIECLELKEIYKVCKQISLLGYHLERNGNILKICW